MTTEDMGFIMGRQANVTVVTDISVLKVPTGGVTVPTNAFEPSCVIMTNHNTTTTTKIDLYDWQVTAGSTVTGITPKLSASLAAGEQKVYNRDMLLGIKFFYEVTVNSSTTNICHVHVAGQIIR